MTKPQHARDICLSLDLLRPLDIVVRTLHSKQLGHLSERKLRSLVDLLAEAREQP